MSDTCRTCKYREDVLLNGIYQRSLVCAACLDYDLWSPRPWTWPQRIVVWLLILGALALGLSGPTP